jgi:voltage-gated potassium channel
LAGAMPRDRTGARRRVGAADWLMLVLALVSVAMLVYETWGPVTPEQREQILAADLVIIAIFAVEFAFRWARDPKPRTFPLRNWYELLGMIPVAHPAVRGFRLFRIIRIAVILSRFGRAADRAFGDEFTYRLLRRFKSLLVDTLSGAITLRVLEETAQVLEKGTYAQNLADALEARGEEMLALAVEKVKADPEVGAVRHLPFFEPVVAASSRVTQRIAIDLLRDDRMEAILRDIIRANVKQIQAAIERNEAARQLASQPPA